MTRRSRVGFLCVVWLAGCEPTGSAVPLSAVKRPFALKACVLAGNRRADCGTLMVPERRDLPGTRYVALPVVRVRAAAPAGRDPVFWLEGGPGMRNVSGDVPSWLAADRDYVMVGYRGVDGSVVLACPEVERALRGMGPDLLGPVSLRVIGEASGSCARRHAARGVDLSAYGIEDVVEDLEAARRALGYARISLFAVSYGTRVAQRYAARYPDHVARVVQVGVNPPGRFVFEPDRTDTLLQALGERCTPAAGCPAADGDLAGAMRRVRARLPRRWMGVPIDEGKVRTVSFALLFQRQTAAQVIDAWVAADHGDFSGLAVLSVASDFVLPTVATWGDFFAKGSVDYDPLRDYQSELEPPGASLGSPMSLLVWGALTRTGTWPLPARRASSDSALSPIETLLISGNLDLSTPAANGDALLQRLPRGRHVVVRDMGHVPDLMLRQPEAFQRMVRSFLDSGIADTSALQVEPMDFHVPWRLTTLAKGAVAGVAILGVTLLGALAWGIRRWRHRVGPTPWRHT